MTYQYYFSALLLRSYAVQSSISNTEGGFILVCLWWEYNPYQISMDLHYLQKKRKTHAELL